MRRMKMNNNKKTEEGTSVHLYYQPESHKGKPNKENKAFPYDVKVFESFENIARKENFAGVEGMDMGTGKWKRFRMDRIECMVPLND